MDRVSYLAVFCAIFAITSHCAAAQTVHIVGDGLGWTIPPNPASYANWAAGKTFRVGDILVFNFVTNRDDVVQVPKASFDVCSDDDEIGEEIKVGPANITLTTPGDRYYISTFDGHCNAGQKLAITVVSSSTPGGANAPSPSQSPNTGAPTGARPPTPTPTVHIVGDGLGWTIPPNPSTYSNWAAGKTFRVGDILVFNFVTNRDDVEQVPKASFDVCSDDDEIGEEIKVGPANITLTTPGDHYYISTFDGHCNAGQKLAITVVASTSGGANAPTPSSSPNTGAPTGSRPLPPTPAVHIVGDGLGWTIPPTTSTYANWAAGKTFRVGDVLVFNFPTNRHDVVEVPKASFDACSDDNEIGEEINVGPANITLTTPGDHYYLCTLDGHCNAGQKLAITVVSSTPGGANAPSTGGANSPSTGGAAGATPPNSASTSLVTSYLLIVLSIGVALTF